MSFGKHFDEKIKCRFQIQVRHIKPFHIVLEPTPIRTTSLPKSISLMDTSQKQQVTLLDN